MASWRCPLSRMAQGSSLFVFGTRAEVRIAARRERHRLALGQHHLYAAFFLNELADNVELLVVELINIVGRYREEQLVVFSTK